MKSPRSRLVIAGAAVLGVVSVIPGTATQAAPGQTSGSVTAASSERAKPAQSDSLRFRKLVRPRAIMDHLRELQVVADRYGDRSAGSEGYNASSRYIEAELRDAGYQPRRQYFDFTYTRVNSNSFTADGAEVENTVMTGSPNTDGEVAGDLVAPTDPLGCLATDYGADAAGKIALVSRGTCSFGEKSTAAKAAGAVGAVIYNNAAGELNGTLGEASPDFAPTVGITQAAGQALAADVAAGPVPATLDLDILIEQRRTWNVIAETKKGRPGNVVMTGAHLDGVQGGAGINDNGSGSAALLETAIQMKKVEGKLKNQVRFAWWAAEEIGLLGSTHYVNDMVENRPAALDNISTYLNYDMIGSPNFMIGVYDADESSDPASAPVPAGSIETERAFRRYFRSIDQPVVDTPFSGRSDYQAFIVNGVASGGLFSGADGVKTERQAELFGGTAGITYDPNYHSPADDFANVNVQSVNIMSNAIAHMMITLGKSTAQIDTPSGTQRKRLVRPSLPEGTYRR